MFPKNSEVSMKHILFFLFLTLLISEQIIGQNLEEIQSSISKKVITVNQMIDELNSLENKYPKFQINGEINDRDRDLSVLQVWGTAIPLNNDYNSYGTQLEKGNIVIKNPEKDKINYNYYVSGIHYFIEKSYGKNALGVEVPVYIYGDIPNLFAQSKINSLRKDISEIKNQLTELREQKRKLEIEKYVREGQELFALGKYTESAAKYKSVLEIDGGNSSMYNKKISESFYENGNRYFDRGDYESAISNYDQAINYYSEKRIKERKASSYEKIGDKNFRENKNLDAIENYEKAISIYPEIENSVNQNLAFAYLNLGKQDLSNNAFQSAAINFKKSYSIDNERKEDIEPLLSNIRRTPILYGAMSIIPGLGQFAQGKTTKGITHLSLFSASLVASILLDNSSKETYNDYKVASTTEEAKSLYKKANDSKLYSNVALGISAGVIIWSIIDSFSEAVNYNEPFYLSANTSFNYNYDLSKNSCQLSLLLKF